MLARMLLAGPVEFSPLEAAMVLFIFASYVLTPIGAVLLLVGSSILRRQEDAAGPAADKSRRRGRILIRVGTVLCIPLVLTILGFLLSGIKDAH